MTDPIEIMARALWIHENSATISDAASVWDHPESVEHALYWTQRMADNHPAYRDRVRAANAALTEAGYAIVPASGTIDMVAAFWRQKNAGTQEVGETGPDTHDMAAMQAAIQAGRLNA